MVSKSNNNTIVPRLTWQWKSNSNPWSKAEESEWHPYSPEINYLIEKAFDEDQSEVDIGEYIVSIQDMIQTKKGNITLQRPIRRISCEDGDETDLRNERYFETELPKSINKIFGNLKHFISFFSRRNQEILDFTKQFEEIELTNNLKEFNNSICPQLICSLEKELLKPIDEQPKDAAVSEFQKQVKQKDRKRHEELIFLFKKDFTSFEEFYGAIFRSYTMNTDLYMSLNKSLRNESWTAIDNLLPYAVCLCKAFFNLNHSQKEKINLLSDFHPIYEMFAHSKF